MVPNVYARYLFGSSFVSFSLLIWFLYFQVTQGVEAKQQWRWVTEYIVFANNFPVEQGIFAMNIVTFQCLLYLYNLLYLRSLICG